MMNALLTLLVPCCPTLRPYHTLLYHTLPIVPSDPSPTVPSGPLPYPLPLLPLPYHPAIPNHLPLYRPTLPSSTLLSPNLPPLPYHALRFFPCPPPCPSESASRPTEAPPTYRALLLTEPSYLPKPASHPPNHLPAEPPYRQTNSLPPMKPSLHPSPTSPETRGTKREPPSRTPPNTNYLR